MNSSTSSFKSEMKVIGLVVATLLLCELTMRQTEQWFSRDLQHIRAIPEIAQKMARKDGPHILFMGNSLTRSDIDGPALQKELATRGLEHLNIERVHPDSSTIVTWYFGFKKYFINANQMPDVLIVDFVFGDLRDDAPFDVAALGGIYADRDDVSEAFAYEVPSFGGRTEFMLARCSTAYMNRARVSPNVFDLFVPNYRPMSERIRTVAKANQVRAGAGQNPAYHRLEQLLGMAGDHKIPVILVAMPAGTGYEIDAEMRAVVQRAGSTLIDGRSVPGLTGSSFTDGLHLDPAASIVYSRYLAQLLTEPLRAVLTKQPGPTRAQH